MHEHGATQLNGVHDFSSSLKATNKPGKSSELNDRIKYRAVSRSVLVDAPILHGTAWLVAICTRLDISIHRRVHHEQYRQKLSIRNAYGVRAGYMTTQLACCVEGRGNSF